MNTARILAAVLLAATLFTVLPARAEEAAGFGIVDTDRVLKTSSAAKSISDALVAKRKEFATEIAKDQEKLRAESKQLEKEQAALPKDKQDEKRKAFSEKVGGLQKALQARERTLDIALGQAMAKLRKETAVIVSEIAKEKNFSVVFTQEAVMLSRPQMDITAEVIKRLDSRLKKVPIDWSAATPKKAG